MERNFLKNKKSCFTEWGNYFMPYNQCWVILRMRDRFPPVINPQFSKHSKLRYIHSYQNYGSVKRSGQRTASSFMRIAGFLSF
jgi:hypothetical protein